MRSYKIALVGKMPALMHADNIEWADAMDRWKADVKNKKGSKAGDDRPRPIAGSARSTTTAR